MKIIPAEPTDKKIWNSFVKNNYPSVGGFLQTWEWGEFKKNWGKKINRYFIKDNGQIITAFTLVEHQLPLGFCYNYVPRGPVLVKNTPPSQITKIFSIIRDWALNNCKHSIFLRLAPPITGEEFWVNAPNLFYRPNYYVQPRYNLAIDLSKTEEEILASFHPSTRSNLNRAKRRGVTVFLKDHDLNNSQNDFWKMTKDTIDRNSGKNLYPPRAYFDSMFKILPPLSEKSEFNKLTIGAFFGYQYDKPAAIHYVLFFGDTATYLYGASATKCLKSKVTTYLHWQAACKAKKRGFKYYDLGGIDEKLWPSITTFKRQFGGTEFSYIGLVDIPLRPKFYCLYNFLKKIQYWIDKN